MKIFIISFAAAILSITSCKKNESRFPDNPVGYKPISTVNPTTYLALGDSYTIGEALPLVSSFPYQLARILDTLNVSEPKIIARTGWTTDELIKAIDAQNLASKYDFVTLLIGVNNQYRNYSIDTYRTEFRKLLGTAIAYASGKEERVFVISIPDWGVTPFGKSSGRPVSQIAQEIDAYNAINKQETAKTKAVYLDITAISRLAETDRSLVADDGLAPLCIMYAKWVEKLKPLVEASFKH